MQGCATLPRPGCSGKYARVARPSPGSGAPPEGGVNYPRFHGKGRGKGSRMRFGTWNVGSLTGRLVEVVEVMRRRRINILCILIDRYYIDDVVDVSRKSDRIMSIKLVLGDEVVNIVSAYAPQAGLDASTRQEFWEDLEEVVQRVPRSEKLIIGGDLNGHVGSSRDGFESIHGGFWYGERNEAGNAILDFALAYDLGIMNTWFEKRESHLVTYRSGDNASQIGLFLVRNALRQCYTNCKVIPGESTATQHRLVVLDFRGRSYIRRRRPLVEPRIKW
ncbi:uncharacterized protein [Spinacia oleracea]|uniref:Endonuclease/exonuclease/phosphatase domain-containing protein n=1 Tax=Spinacia oleracea TaxID=3562 RepID=A0ABM3RGN4_SPIOL|nr:uncharacterized protein LOC110802026 [Spinacia oleracea]